MRGGAGKHQGGTSGRSGLEWAGRRRGEVAGHGQSRTRGGTSGDGAGPQGFREAKGGAMGKGCCGARPSDLGSHRCRGMTGVGAGPYRTIVKGGNV